MRILIDAAHGADVWMLGAVEDRLRAEGAETLWLSRPGKDSVVELIEARGARHIPGPRAGVSTLSLARELVARDWRAWRLIRDFDPDVVVTRSPAGVHAARLARRPVLYDTDDGPDAGFLFRVAAPLATVVSSPRAMTQDCGRDHRRYGGYKELFYLHPERFTPDPSIRDELGLADGERLFVLRLTSFTAAHDTGESGMTEDLVAELIERLERSGAVRISSESELSPELARLRIRTPSERFHHVLAAAAMVIGDSQTVCSEAAILGTPSIRFNTWAGRLPYQVELEEKWGLTRAFLPSAEEEFFVEIDRVLDDIDAVGAAHGEARQRMLDASGDPVDDLVGWIKELGESGRSRRPRRRS